MGRLRGCLWLTAGVVVALLAGAIAYITLDRAAAGRGGGAEAGPTVSAVVALRPVSVGSVLTAEDVAVKEFPVAVVPVGAIQDPASAVGKITMVDLYEGEIILSQRLVDPNVISGDGRIALFLVEDQVLMALPAVDLMSKVGVLKPGDHVDLLFSLDFPYYTAVQAAPAEAGAGEAQPVGTTVEEQQEQVTFDLLQNIVVAEVVRAGDDQAAAPQALLLTISPQDALTLKYAVDAGGVLDIVLRAPGAEGPFETEPVDLDYLIDRYDIPTGRRR